MLKTLNHVMADGGLLMPWILEIHLFITLWPLQWAWFCNVLHSTKNFYGPFFYFKYSLICINDFTALFFDIPPIVC